MDIDALLSRITPEMTAGDGAGVRVAVIDSGVQPDAPAIRGRRVEGVVIREVGKDADGKPVFRHEPDPGRSAGAHGTIVAGIILEIAPKAEICSVNIAAPGREATVDLLVEGLRWSLAHGCRVINLSFGLVRADVIAARRLALAEAVEAAYWSGAVVVAAAHPDHPAVAAIPATFPVPVSVNRRTFADPMRFGYAANGNVEFEAHGTADIAGRQESSVTFAAPHLAGYACRLRGRHPDLKPFEIKTVLYRLAGHFAKTER